MCGIVGYLGNKSAVEIVIEGLKALEYRGYDSAGIAVIENEDLIVTRSKGKIVDLENKIDGRFKSATIGIGHTRWATHGKPSDHNSHPHSDCKGEISLVHNGIIENFLELRKSLTDAGHIFTSDTDTEVIAHLIESYYKGNLLQAVSKAVKELTGAYSLAIICKNEPDTIITARKDSPLIIGIGEDEYFIASDIPAIMQHTKDYIVMDDYELASVTREGIVVYDAALEPVEKEILRINWTVDAAQKSGYEHFMAKEIFEQPVALQNTLKGRISEDKSRIFFDDFNFDSDLLKKASCITVVACGTSYHAGLIGKSAIESILRIPVNVEIASEFRYKDPIIDEKSIVIVISQSGETADTLAALRESKSRGAYVIAITNVLGSAISREANSVIYTYAGPEIAVASTKAYITQLMALYLLTMYFAQESGVLEKEQIAEYIMALCKLPEQVKEILEKLDKQILKSSEYFNDWQDCFFIGRGMDYAVSMEGALKLKEISYIHAEAYASGELKHGTIALIDEGVPVIALCTQGKLIEKAINNIEAVKSRGAKVFGIGFDDESKEKLKDVFDEGLYLPQTLDMFAPVLTVVPMQLLSYYVATSRGCNPDQPKNLAKSVTVE